jgi:chaperonin cofactor prefoldin
MRRFRIKLRKLMLRRRVMARRLKEIEAALAELGRLGLQH